MQAGHSFFDDDAPLRAIRSLFDQYDTNGSGKLEQEELKNFLERDLGLRPDQSNVYSLLVDKDGDQVISFDEFLAWMRSGERFEHINDSWKFMMICKAVDYFKKYDTDDNNTLDVGEFKALMKSLGYEEPKAEEMFQKLDKFKAGKLSFWEFAKWLNWVPIKI